MAQSPQNLQNPAVTSMPSVDGHRAHFGPGLTGTCSPVYCCVGHMRRHVLLKATEGSPWWLLWLQQPLLAEQGRARPALLAHACGTHCWGQVGLGI